KRGGALVEDPSAQRAGGCGRRPERGADRQGCVRALGAVSGRMDPRRRGARRDVPSRRAPIPHRLPLRQRPRRGGASRGARGAGGRRELRPPPPSGRPHALPVALESAIRRRGWSPRRRPDRVGSSPSRGGVRRMMYWLLKNVILGPLLRLLYRPKAKGLENLPADGPVILACNHQSFIDSMFVPLLVKRQVVFLGKADY